MGELQIRFKRTAPGKLYWASRPAMRVVQALHGLKSELAAQTPAALRLRAGLAAILAGSADGSSIRADLRRGMERLPAWMQALLHDLAPQFAASREIASSGDPVPHSAAIPPAFARAKSLA